MGRELTKRYSLLFQKKGVKDLFSFIDDLRRYQKFSELVSFIVWELFHKLRLFPKNKYLRFNNRDAIRLENDHPTGPDFSKVVSRFFSSRELSATNSHHNWKRLFINDNGEMFGCFYPHDRDLYKSTDNGKSIVFVQRFPERIRSMFISSQNTIFVSAKGAVYKISAGGDSFRKSLDFGSARSFFRYNNGMTETPTGTLIIGEYGNVLEKRRWKTLAYLYFSSDDGETWERSDFLLKKGTNKHVHIVSYSKLLNKILVADGDNKKKLWKRN